MNDGYTQTRILWRSDELESLERFTSEPTAGGRRFDGVVVLPLDGEPSEIRYGIELDHDWLTRRADVTVAAATGDRTISFAADGGGGWTVEGAPADPLDGALDVDLGFTPATNTLQIRRLGLEVGESRALPVAWLRFPELSVERLVQTYTRLGTDRWRYGDEEFSAELLVDPSGYVLRYGDGLWRAVAHRPG